MKGGLAESVLPYEEEESYTIERVSLVETNTGGGTDEVDGLEIYGLSIVRLKAGMRLSLFEAGKIGFPSGNL